MSTALPIGYALFCWWFATGVVFVVERRTRGKSSLAVRAGVVVVAVVASYALVRTSSPRFAGGAGYAGFATAIVLWGALEVGFLSGWITGPAPSGPDARGWKQFGRAVQALLYHELSLLGAVAIGWLSWLGAYGRGDATGAWTLTILWAMRESAKLNLHFGVRNPGLDLLPPQLAHLRSYFGAAPGNALLPVSIGAAAAVDAWLLHRALDDRADAAAQASCLMLATLLALAIVEHLLLAVPVRGDFLWRWATRRRDRPARPAGAIGF